MSAQDVNTLLGSTIPIPESVAVCPYCWARLSARVEEAELTDAGSVAVSSITVDCLSEPDIESPDWKVWFAHHSYMPYVYKLPVYTRILAWIQREWLG